MPNSHPWSEIVAALHDAETIAVAGHVGPDGDALGSMLAIAIAARNAGNQAFATFGEPFVVPDQLKFLDMETLVTVRDVPEQLDLLVVVDCGDRQRLGSAAVLADRAAKVAVIDHHITNTGFGDMAWIEGGTAATAQMVHKVLLEAGWPITKPIAEALYTGIVTDTGRFQYSSTAPETHSVAAQLLEAGVEPDAIGQRLFEQVPFGYLAVAGAVMSRTVLVPEVKFAWSSLDMEDLSKAGVTYEQVDGLIDLIRIVDEAEVACLLREIGNRRVKGSLRSRGTYDVGAIAVGFGGGGHRNAAGFTFEGCIEDAVSQIEAAIAAQMQ